MEAWRSQRELQIHQGKWLLTYIKQICNRVYRWIRVSIQVWTRSLAAKKGSKLEDFLPMKDEKKVIPVDTSYMVNQIH